MSQLADIDLGRGLFSATEVARYVALEVGASDAFKPERPRDWLRGILSTADHVKGRPDFTFDALISAFVVAMLRSRGVTMHRIEQARQTLERHAQLTLPFAYDGILTDGISVFADLGVVGQYSNLNAPGENLSIQEAAKEALEINLERVCFATGDRLQDRPARSWAPIAGVRVDPSIQFGEPCVAGTRMQTALIRRLVDDLGVAVDTIAEDYELDSAEVRAALEFERALAAVAV